MKSQIIDNVSYLKTPLLFATIYNFAIGNFVVHISLALMNDVLREKIDIINDDSVLYEDYYKLFNTLRGVVAVVVCPVMGMVSDQSIKLFDAAAPNLEVKRILLPGVLIHGLLVLFGVSLFFTGLLWLWVSMLSIMVITAWVYVYEAIGKNNIIISR